MSTVQGMMAGGAAILIGAAGSCALLVISLAWHDRATRALSITCGVVGSLGMLGAIGAAALLGLGGMPWPLS